MVTLSTNYLMQNYLSDNCLLKKDDVGQAKQTIYDLPGLSFIYGKSPKPDSEGVKDCNS